MARQLLLHFLIEILKVKWKINMKFKYIQETDTFYLKFSDNKSSESEEISENVIADFDESGKLIGIEFLSAKSMIDFSSLTIDSLPYKNFNMINAL